MEVIRSRNPQTALASMLQSLYAEGEQTDDGNLVLDHPVLYTFENPRERLIFWPGILRNPAHEMRQALASIAPTEEHFDNAATAIIKGNTNALFSTPQLMVQGRLRPSGHIDMHAVVTETNPFIGAFGQLGLQLSILLELIAGAGKKNVGELTIQHQRVLLPAPVVSQLIRASLENLPADPYTKGLKPRKIDGPLNINALLEAPTETMGVKSKWVRHVAGPLLRAGLAQDAEEGMDLAKSIKADDWRRAMVEWFEAVAAAAALKRAQEGDSAEG